MLTAHISIRLAADEESRRVAKPQNVKIKQENSVHSRENSPGTSHVPFQHPNFRGVISLKYWGVVSDTDTTDPASGKTNWQHALRPIEKFPGTLGNLAFCRSAFFDMPKKQKKHNGLHNNFTSYLLLCWSGRAQIWHSLSLKNKASKLPSKRRFSKIESSFQPTNLQQNKPFNRAGFVSGEGHFWLLNMQWSTAMVHQHQPPEVKFPTRTSHGNTLSAL